MIDYFFLFTNSSVAQVDSVMSVFFNGTSWDQSTTFPNVNIATPAALINGISPLTGFWIIVSQNSTNPSLDAHANLVMKLDRDLGKVNGNFVLAASISGTNRTNLNFQPVPFGSGYPRPLGK